jgi:hypothetical protein
LAYEIRERRPGYKVTILPIVIGCLGGGERKLESHLKKILKDDMTVKIKIMEMERTVLCESETIIRNVISGLVQTF